MGTLQAQDPIFSQFNFNKLYLNPAFAGHNGGLSISLNNHNHLLRVPGDYRTVSGSMDFQMPCNNIGLGIIAMNEKEGVIPLRRNSFGIVGSYIFDDLIKDKITKYDSRDINFSIGLALRYVNLSVDTDGAIYSSQLDHIHGIINTVPNTDIMLENKDYLDSDIGFVAVYNKDEGENYTLSFSVSHLRATNPDESLQNRGVRRPAKYTTYVGTYFPFKIAKQRFALSPHALFNKQGAFENLTIGTYLMGNVTTKGSSGVYFGGFYQNTWYPSFTDANSFIINVGINGIQPPGSPAVFAVGYSADIPNRGLNLGTSHEISIRIQFPNARPFCPSSAKDLFNCNKFIQ